MLLLKAQYIKYSFFKNTMIKKSMHKHQVRVSKVNVNAFYVSFKFFTSVWVNKPFNIKTITLFRTYERLTN